MLTGSLRKQPGLRSPSTGQASWARAHACMCVPLCVGVHVCACAREWELVCVSAWVHVCCVGICVQHARPRTLVHSCSLSRARSRCLSGIGQHRGVDWLAAGLQWTHRPGGEPGAASGDSLTIVAVKGSERAAGLSSAPAGFLGREGVGWGGWWDKGREGQQNWGQGAVGRESPGVLAETMNCSGKQSESQTWSKGEGGGPGPGSCRGLSAGGLARRPPSLIMAWASLFCVTPSKPSRQRVVSRRALPTPASPGLGGFSWLGCWFCRVPGRFQVAVEPCLTYAWASSPSTLWPDLGGWWRCCPGSQEINGLPAGVDPYSSLPPPKLQIHL